MFVFGFPPVKGFILAWGARAIYKRPANKEFAKTALDFLPDRQQLSDYNHPQKHEFARQINEACLPRLHELLPYMDGGSDERVELIFEADFALGKKIVLRGSPNASFGYFYLSASLVTHDLAPKGETYPERYRTPEQVAGDEKSAAIKASELDAMLQRDREARMRERAKGKDRAREMAARIEESRHRECGDSLEAGDHVRMFANQADRDGFVVAVTDDRALVEYHMPNGNRHLREVTNPFYYDMDQKTINKNRLPKRWKQTA